MSAFAPAVIHSQIQGAIRDREVSDEYLELSKEEFLFILFVDK
jgi:hypothetical protein